MKTTYTNARIYWTNSSTDSVSEFDGVFDTVKALKKAALDAYEPLNHDGGELVAEMPNGECKSYRVTRAGKIGNRIS